LDGVTKLSQIFVSYFTKPDLILPLYGCVESKIAPESIARWP
jgi:hypothetical protein